MPFFDCRLDHHPLVRIEASDAAAAKAEYFRRYAIASSTAAWNCKKAEADSAAPAEPLEWVKRRRELGTLSDSELECAGAAEADVALKKNEPKD